MFDETKPKQMEREKWNNCIDLSVHHRLATLLTDTHTQRKLEILHALIARIGNLDLEIYTQVTLLILTHISRNQENKKQEIEPYLVAWQ